LRELKNGDLTWLSPLNVGRSGRM